uniref:SHSP domain-containing protein n=1 Tax=Arion vulgaris TaxID=1028688 RepID=A0A0B7A950_9EUPU
MFQIFAGPQDATDKQNMMSLSNVLDSILFNFGEPVTIRKASTASPKASDRLKADKEFLVHLELQDYQPEEVKITADNHQVTVTAKHGQRPDNFGYVSRKITRVINLPEVRISVQLL